MSEPPVLVLGGGLLGAAIARQVAAQQPVVVCSRTPRPHPGLWRRLDDTVEFSSGQKVFVALGPSPAENGLVLWGELLPRLLDRLDRAGSKVQICGPVGGGEPGIDLFVRVTAGRPVLRLPLLFGKEDAVIWPMLRRLREGEVVRVRRGLPSVAPLWVEDAARAAIAGVQGSLRGPDRWEVAEILDLLVLRYGGSWSTRLLALRTAAERRAEAQVQGEDSWLEQLGERLSLESWLDRLPGPRRVR